MTTHTQAGVLLAIQGRSIDKQRRVTMIRELTTSDDDTALQALVRVAQDECESEAITAAAGTTLAEILIRMGAIDDAPLHDFSGPAYVAFDAVIAMNQRAQ